METSEASLAPWARDRHHAERSILTHATDGIPPFRARGNTVAGTKWEKIRIQVSWFSSRLLLTIFCALGSRIPLTRALPTVTASSSHLAPCAEVVHDLQGTCRPCGWRTPSFPLSSIPGLRALCVHMLTPRTARPPLSSCAGSHHARGLRDPRRHGIGAVLQLGRHLGLVWHAWGSGRARVLESMFANARV